MLWPEQTMSGGPSRPPPLETEAAAANAASAWLRTIGGQAGTMTQPMLRQYDISQNPAQGTTTTTTRHFAAWEQTTTHFPPPSTSTSSSVAASIASVGQHSHPALLASVNLKASPVIRPIASRLSSPGPKELVGPSPSQIKPPVKLESRPFLDVTDDLEDVSSKGGGHRGKEEAEDSAFEDWNCSRTTPINHTSIRKWRQKSGNSTYSSNSIQPISISTTSPFEAAANGGPLSAPSGLHAWQPHRPGSAGFSSPNDSLFTSPASNHSGDSSHLRRRLKTETMTSPDSVSSVEDSKSGIPVGIAVARQRTTVTTTASEVTSAGEIASKSLEDSGIEIKRPPPPPPPPPRPPTTSEQAAFIESWLRQPQLWPLSYPAPAISGYQFVKDPLTGQMFFVPGFGTPHPLTATSIWPPPAAAAHASTAASAAAAFASLTPFQQSLMQLQQESLMVRQGFLFNQPQPPSPEAARPMAPPPAPVLAQQPPPEVKINEASEAEEEQLSVGDEAEVKVKVKIEAEKSDEPSEKNGLHLLTQGIDRLESERPNSVQPKLEHSSPTKESRLGILCDAAFLSDDEHHLKSDHLQSPNDLKARSRSLDKERRLSSDYRSPKAERNAKAFIASKSLKVCEDLKNYDRELQPRSSPLRQPQPSRMDDWERKMRSDLASIQKKYKEKYKELYKLQHKSALQSPHKKAAVTATPSAASTKTSASSSKIHQVTKKTLAPISPWLQTFKLKLNGQTPPVNKAEHSPKALTETRSNGSSTGPDLSAITSKFRSARPNPFENLLKLSGGQKQQQQLSEVVPRNESEAEDMPGSEHKPLMTSTPKLAINNGHHHKKKEAFILSNDLNHESLPKLHAANNNKVLEEQRVHEDTEAIEADISDEEEDDLDAPPVLEPMQEPPPQQPQSNNIRVKIKRPPSPEPEQPPRSCSSPKAKKSKKEKKAKKASKEKHRHHHKKHHKKIIVSDDSKAPPDCIDLLPKTMTNNSESVKESINDHEQEHSHDSEELSPDSCVIKEEDLKEDLRVLVKLDGHFHPGKIQAISPPDIYGVLVDKERGNKPHIFSREEVLREAIFEVKPPTMGHLLVGTRVCAYWSQKYHHLYPGTISDMDIDPKLSKNEFINIELDDGDNRDIHVNSIRFLPSDYPLVVYDPDPLMSTLSRRKRRQSWESGTSDGSRATKTPRASLDGEMPAQPHLQRHHAHAGDLKMRIHVPSNSQNGVNQSKQKKSETNVNSTTKTIRTLAQRPSISSSSDSDDGKGGIASFLPKDQVWKWADKGQKRSKGRVYHKVIERKDERLGIGDSAVFLSTNCPDQPYIGRLESMWETASGTKNVGVRWYYHLAEIECTSTEDKQKLKKLKKQKGALFESNHYDENDVQTISHRCDVQTYKTFAKHEEDEEEHSDNDKYYLAGIHNAIEKTVQFSPDVLSCYL